MSNRRKPSGLRAALAAKKVRVESFDIPLVDFETAEAAAKAYRDKRELADMAEYADDADYKAKALKDAAAAKKALDECFYRVEFRGLSQGDFDALVNEHPATEEQSKAGDAWGDGFLYALVEACILDGDGMTADEWKAELNTAERWPRADRARFLNAVLSANQRDFSEGIPKG